MGGIVGLLAAGRIRYPCPVESPARRLGRAAPERCPSGRRSSTGNAVLGLNPIAGSNPALSVSQRTPAVSTAGVVFSILLDDPPPTCAGFVPDRRGEAWRPLMRLL